jgi:WD40 repeat protein
MNLTGHTKPVIDAVIALRNNFLASGSNDNTVRIWNTFNGQLIKTIYLNSSVKSLAVLNNGDLAIGCVGDLYIERISKLLKNF